MRFQGSNLFAALEAIGILAAAGCTPLEGLGFVVFKNLGIALADFDGGQESDRIVQLFQRGRWDAIK